MDDLVKRLRMAGDWARKDYPQFKSQHVTEEAADRIEQLKAALETVMRSAGHTEADIRAALGKKKDDKR